MMYIVYYVDDSKKRHMTFLKTFKEVQFIMDRFYDVTFNSYKVDE